MKNLLAMVIFCITPLALADNYIFDKKHTQIFFSASHLGFSTSTGAFVEFDGKFNFDQSDFSQSAVNVVIQTNSIDLNDKKWNEHMMGQKWFNVKKYPTMEFKSTSVKKTGDKTMDITGDFTLLGVTKTITLKTTFNKFGSQFGREKAGFSATTTIDRTEFGMKNYSPAISAEIPIRIEVEGYKVQE